MNNFKKSGRPGGGGGGWSRGQDRQGRKSFGGGGGRPPLRLYDATCARCNNECQVPFRPNGKKPVYCRECFGGTKSDAPAGNFKTRDHGETRAPQAFGSDKRLDDMQRQLNAIEEKLDALMEALTESDEES